MTVWIYIIIIIYIVLILLMDDFPFDNSKIVHGWVSGRPRGGSLDATFADYENFLVHEKKKQNDTNIVLAFDTGDMILVYLSFSFFSQ